MHNALTTNERQKEVRSITARFGTQVPPDVRTQCDLLIEEGNYDQQLLIIRALHDLMNHVEISSFFDTKDIIDKGGGKFYGPESLKVMRLKVPDPLPPLPPLPEIKRYAKRGFSLRLMSGTAIDQASVTSGWMGTKLQEVFDATPSSGKVLWNDPDTNWYKKKGNRKAEPFYTDARVDDCWIFTSDKLLDGSTGMNYLEQTDRIAQYAKEILYEGKPSKDVDDAIAQFQSERGNIAPIITGDRWKNAADALARLHITQMFRPEAQDVLFSFTQTFLNSPPNQRERLLEALLAWTKTQCSEGSLVYAGECDPKGAHVYRYNPGVASSRLGVLLVRKFRALVS